MGEIKSNSDRGKEIISSESSQSKDITKILFKAKERLELDSSHRFLPGGMKQQDLTIKQDASVMHEDKRLDLMRRRLQEQRDGSGIKLEPSDGVGSLHEDMELDLMQRRLQEQRDDSSVASNSSDSFYWQGSEIKSRPDTNTSEFYERAGSGRGEETTETIASRQQDRPNWILGIGGVPGSANQAWSSAPESNTAGYQNPGNNTESLPSGYLPKWDIKPQRKVHFDETKNQYF